jgi:hypothetical protein
MVLEKRKSFMQKSGTRRSLCRLRPRLLHVVLDVFLIVCLVVFERSYLAPCVVLVINDNPYGLMVALSYMCRTCP